MNKEERQQYNKEYYERHKPEIMAKLCQKVECEFCHRTIIRNNLIIHQQTAICKRKAALLLQNQLRKLETETLLKSN